MKKMSIVFGIVVLILIWGRSLESRAASGDQPKGGGTLIFGVGKEPGNPNPFIATSSISQFVKETAYESLLTENESGNIIPNLAERYDVSAKGKEIILHLRRGVKFHNGKEMKADDVIWSAEHVKNVKNGAFGQNLIKDVISFAKINDYTVKFTLVRPSAAFLSRLSNIRMLPIVPANSLKPGQIKLQKNAFVPGTGPFIFEKFQPGFDTVVNKFPNYWGGAAYVDKIIFRPISDSASRFNAIRTGDIHLADRIAPLDVDRVRKGSVKKIRILEEPLGGFQHLVFMNDNPLFKKIEMRQAVSYAIDKKQLVDEVFFGAANVSDLMMGGIWSREANLPAHKYSVEKAKTLLKTAGYGGQELTMISQKSQAQLAAALQRMLGQGGINVKVEVLEGGIKKERSDTGKYDFNIDGGNVTSDPIITMAGEYYTTKTERGRYSNPKVDQLIDNLDKEFDQQKQLKIFKELAWILHNDVASVPLVFEIRYVAMSDKIHGFGPPKGFEYIESGNYFKHVWIK